MATVLPADPAEVRTIIKLRFKITDVVLDALIDSYIRELGRRIRHYCNISEIPEDLTDVWVSMVMDALRIEQPDAPGIAENVPDDMGVRIGDTQTAPAARAGEVTSLNKSVIDGIVLNYAIDLRRYRRLSW